MLTKDWYELERAEDLDSPCLLIYEERVKKNIDTAIDMVVDVNHLRPHIKTSKCRQVVRLMKKAGISKFKCATIAEADLLGMIGAPDVLLAYQVVGPKLDRYISLVKDYPHTKFACLADNYDAALALSVATEGNYVQARVFIDINVGMNRTGILPGQEALDLFLYCAGLKGIVVAGFHVYDGHLHMPGLEERKEKAMDGIHKVNELKNQLEQKGYRDLLIVAGGSPTFPIHAANRNVESSPGTFIFWDAGYAQSFPEQMFLPAALVLSRIISLPGRNLVCTDLGHKSVAAENIISKRVVFLNALELVPVSHSEEHMVLEAPEGHSYKTGDILYGLPYHICPTVALYQNASVIREKQVREEWLIEARDRRLEH